MAIPPQKPLKYFKLGKNGALSAAISNDIAFSSGKSDLKRPIKKVLRDINDEIAASNYKGEICVIGFADGVGTPEANSALSSKRAETVTSFLRGLNKTNRFVARGLGEIGAKDGIRDSKRRRVEVGLNACDNYQERSNDS
jgi:outer membrane protein OmpA-like peptidoglycan-associated protein